MPEWMWPGPAEGARLWRSCSDDIENPNRDRGGGREWIDPPAGIAIIGNRHGQSDRAVNLSQPVSAMLSGHPVPSRSTGHFKR
jgi:hypothetical protein